MLAEAGLTADRAGFDVAMEEQRSRSRATRRSCGVAEDKAYEVGDVPATTFVGFERLESPGDGSCLARR